MKCIYMNGKDNDFIDYVFLYGNNRKRYETRNKRTLNRYCNQIIGIVETGRRDKKRYLVGFCILRWPKLCDSVEVFRNLEWAHKVPAGSKFDITNSKSGKKWLYPIESAVKLDEPIEITNEMIKRRFGRIACEI